MFDATGRSRCLHLSAWPLGSLQPEGCHSNRSLRSAMSRYPVAHARAQMLEPDLTVHFLFSTLRRVTANSRDACRTDATTADAGHSPCCRRPVNDPARRDMTTTECSGAQGKRRPLSRAADSASSSQAHPQGKTQIGAPAFHMRACEEGRNPFWGRCQDASSTRFRVSLFEAGQFGRRGCLLVPGATTTKKWVGRPVAFVPAVCLYRRCREVGARRG